MVSIVRDIDFELKVRSPESVLVPVLYSSIDSQLRRRTMAVSVAAVLWILIILILILDLDLYDERPDPNPDPAIF